MSLLYGRQAAAGGTKGRDLFIFFKFLALLAMFWYSARGGNLAVTLSSEFRRVKFESFTRRARYIHWQANGLRSL